MEQLKTINIKGKEYVQVNERINYFRNSEEFKNWRLETELISFDGTTCMIKAYAKNPEGIVIATAYDCETINDSPINKTSLVMNVETGAVGRVLGFLGIGVNTSIASAEEVERAIEKQEYSNNQNNRSIINNTQNKPNNSQYSNGIKEKLTNMFIKVGDIVQFSNDDGCAADYKLCYSKDKNEYFWAIMDQTLLNSGFKKYFKTEAI